MPGNPIVVSATPHVVAVDPDVTRRRTIAFDDNFFARRRWRFLYYDVFLGRRGLLYNNSWRRWWRC